MDTVGKAGTLLRKGYVAAVVPIAERNLKYLIPEKEYSGTMNTMRSSQLERDIKYCVTL